MQKFTFFKRMVKIINYQSNKRDRPNLLGLVFVLLNTPVKKLKNTTFGISKLCFDESLS
jgi:hypothetical protein